MEIATLKQSVDWLWKIAIGTVVLGLGALVSLFLVLDDRIQDRFEGTDAKITAISDKIIDLKVEVVGQRSDIRSILEKIDADVKTGDRAEPPQTIHPRTP